MSEKVQRLYARKLLCMQNPMQKFRQSSIAFEKPGILSRKLTSFNYRRVEHFLAKILHMFLTYHSLQKGVCDIFYFV